jgi:hypothetical protein
LAYVRGVDAFMNSFSGVSAYAIRKGFQSIGAEDNSVVIFSELAHLRRQRQKRDRGRVEDSQSSPRSRTHPDLRLHLRCQNGTT